MFNRSSIIASILAASAAFASPIASGLTARGVKPQCLPSGIEDSCNNVVSACLFFIGDGTNGTGNQLWHQKACVAAATCYGVGNLVDKVSCQVGSSVTNQAQESLDYNIYAGIVGSCAWAPNGCPITEQNYIDFYYGTLTELNSSSFPSSANTVIAWWSAIASWTATGATIPYLNFNDWLHYSTYPSGDVTSTVSTITSSSATTPSSPTSVLVTTSSVTPTTTGAVTTVSSSVVLPTTTA